MDTKTKEPVGMVKHLRAIHFLIVLASLLTLLAIFSNPSSEVRKAHKQLERVTTIRNSWNTWTKRFSLEQIDWIQSLGIKWIDEEPETAFIETQVLKNKGLIPSSETSLWRLRFDGLPVFFFLYTSPKNGQSRKLILSMPHGRLNKSDTLPLDISFPGTGGTQPFTTIEQFRDFWDSARQPRVWFARELAAEAYFFVGKNLSATVPIKMNPGSGSTLDFRNSALGGCRDEAVQATFWQVREESEETFFCRDLNGASIIITAKSFEPRVPVDLQKWLIKAFDLPGPTGTFLDAFPELYHVTRNYQELSLVKARAILEAELARSGDRIEFLGMSLPENLMATWGGVVIFMLQLYFWLHLRNFPKDWNLSRDLVHDAAWIGIYPDIFARFTAFITLFVIPFGTTVCAVMITDVSKTIAIILSGLVMGISALSACRVWNLSEPYSDSG